MVTRDGGRNHALETTVGVSDMCLLEPVKEDTCMENLQERFNNDIIYTYIGNVVVSINPYKDLPLYSQAVIFKYRSRNIYELPPHIFAISDDAYRSMRDRNLDQCVIISGESGSGKTEASKVIMQYVAAVSGKGQDIDRVKEQLLQSNPVLEAFGNAKTNKNDNSSRFGKYMDIEFDFKGDPVGGVITNYLLEKSRVVEQAPGERSFHIFYQLLCGADNHFLQSLKLERNPDHYEHLRHTNAAQIEGMDDQEMYNIVTNAMLVIGFTESEVISLYQLVACVLKLGNIHFKHHSNLDGTDGCKLLNQNELLDVCKLLSVDAGTLVSALTSRTVNAMKEAVKTDLSAVEAHYARDALCKALYSRLFSWLVRRINDSIHVGDHDKRKSMGVLDIYGFELFENNGFEQFIINYCNEKLQQIFIELTLREEQDEYVREGIEWIHVDYFNNAVICDLIEADGAQGRTGMLAMLDEECLRPGHVSDDTFLTKLDNNCGSHKHYQSRGCRKNINDKSIPHEAFRLVHYAGGVTYRVHGFIDKNNDLLFRDLSSGMYSCQHPLLKQLFPEGNPVKRSLRRPPTAGAQFKKSVNELMKNLQTKCPNYIRCIKPNEHKRADLFDELLVRHQVRYLGLMENIRVKRAGYAFRQKYSVFLFRYKMLCEDTWPKYKGSSKDGVQVLLDYLCVSQEQYAFGRSKIFIANPRTLFSLEATRKDKLHDLATLVQKIWRGFREKKKFRQMKAAEIKIASFYRMYKARERYQEIRRATLTICSYARGWQARKLYRAMVYHKRCVWAQGIIVKYFLGWQVRKLYRAKFRAIAGPKIVNFLEKALRYRFLKRLAKCLPSDSPTERTWPECSILHRNTSNILRGLHHKNRCAIYRTKCDKATRNIMREKVTASDIFKTRKDCYAPSVSHPFRGDYVSLRQNQKWRKIACETNDQQLVFADIVNKINRRNGKTISQLLVLSSNAMLLLDQRTLSIKYRIPVQSVESISLSPFHDTMAAFHLKKQDRGDVLTKKGDFLLISDHVLEIVTKLFLLYKNLLHTSPAVHITTQIVANLNGRQVEIAFKPGVADIPPGSVKITRKGARMEVLEP